MGSGNYVHVQIKKILKETDKSFLVRFHDGEEVWLPKSQIADWEDYNEGDHDVSMSITEWIANEKGIEGEG